MKAHEKAIIEDLFTRLRDVDRLVTRRDPEAAKLIEDLLVGQPHAAYFMAQTITIQAEALERAQAALTALEASIPRARRARRTLATGPRVTQSIGTSASDGFLSDAVGVAMGVSGAIALTADRS